jgi:Glycosyl transferase family 2
MISTRKEPKVGAATGRLQRECPLCGSVVLDYEFIVDNCPICCCRSCSLLFLNPQPETEDPKDAGAPYQGISDVYQIQSTNAATRMQRLVAYLGAAGGRLLMVGADQFLIDHATRLGFEVVDWTVAEFEQNRLEPLDENAFQACILFCSLERSSDPLASLAALRWLIVPGGALLVIAPTIDSRTARIFGAGWWEFARHNRFYFTADTLQSLLIKCGFGEPVIMHDDTVVSLHYMRQKLALSPPRLRYKLLRLLLSLSPGFVRNHTFRFLHTRALVMVRPRAVAPTPRLSVIVPVYNESATFPKLIETVLAKDIDGVEINVIIVESNSTDGSRQLVRQYDRHPRVRVIYEDRPSGKGHAVRKGLAAASGDVILIQDADLEYDIDDYDSLLRPILDYRHNFVIGSRHTINNRIWKIRKFNDAAGLAALFNFGHLTFLTLFNLIYRQRLSDPFSMFKVFRIDCLYGLTFECNRFDFDFELVIKLLRKGYRAFEVPINYRARSFTEGKKVTVFRDPLTWLRALVKYRTSRLYPEYGPGGRH